MTPPPSSPNPPEPIQDAIEDMEHSIQVIAGPGSGKTHFLLSKYIYLLEQAILPEQILLTTYTRAAVGELYSRVYAHFGRPIPNLRIFTIHQFCQRILEDLSGLIPLYPGFSLIDELTQRMIWYTHGIHGFSAQPDSAKKTTLDSISSYEAGILLSFFDRLNEHPDLTARIYRELTMDPSHREGFHRALQYRSSGKTTPISDEQLCDLYGHYNRWMWSQRTLDFALLLKYVYRLACDNHPILVHRLANYKMVLVDEYQDISPIQEALFLFMADQGAKLTVVGDDDQGIYSFRGASREPMLHFSTKLSNVKQVRLEENHRNPQSVVQVSTDLIRHNTQRLFKEPKPRNTFSEPVYWVHTRNFKEQCQQLNQIIQQCLKKGWANHPGEIAVIVKSVRFDGKASGFSPRLLEQSPVESLNKQNSFYDEMKILLEADGIPVQKLGEGDYFNHSYVNQILRLIQTVLTGSVTGSTWAEITFMCFGKIWEHSFLREHPPLELEHLMQQYHDHLTSPETTLLSHLVQLSQQIKQSELSVTEFILRLFQYAPLVHRGIDGDGETLEEIDLISTLLQMASSYDLYCNSNPHHFYELCRTFQEKQQRIGMREPTPTNAVQFMTYHHAKGQEFPVVILPNLIYRNFPGNPKKSGYYIPPFQHQLFTDEQTRHSEEQRTLFYVGMTRARSLLVLSSFAFDQIGNECIPSPYIKEIQKRLHIWNNTTTLGTAPSPKRTKETISRYHLTLTFSQLETYTHCPFLYKLRFIHRFPSPQKKANQIGNCIHHGLHYIHSHIAEGLGFPSLHAFFETQFTRTIYRALTETDQDTIRNGFERYKTWWEEHPREVVASEYAFEYPLKNHLFTGRIDLIIRDESNIYILDFKTGANKSGGNPFQLGVYRLFSCEQFKDSAIQTGFFDFFSTRIQWITWDTYWKEGMIKKVEHLVDQIQARMFNRNRGSHCVRCPFACYCMVELDG
jgi:DNA helicase II / ATP-dependent DNA helicase PcrA